MIIGPILVIGGLVWLLVLAGAEVPTRVSPVWLVLAGLVALWLVSLKVLPKKRCYICKGSGHFGWWRLRRVCDRCKGSGLINRIGSNND